MVFRFTAWLLIVLAASPFTAPFSTCDLSILRTTPHARGVAFVQRAPSIERSDAESAPATILDEDQFNNLTLTAVTSVNPLFNGITVVITSVLRAFVFRTPLITLRL